MLFKRSQIWFGLGWLFVAVMFGQAVSIYAETPPIDIGQRRELFVDREFIVSKAGDIQWEVQQPRPGRVVFTADQPWEGNTSGYYTVFADEDRYRMIYRGWQHDANKKAAHPELTCYAESRDGLRWSKPKLGLHTWNGSTANNIVWQGREAHNFAAFRDTRPNVPENEKYKALGGDSRGLTALVSPDCQRWRKLQEKPVITAGAFDSQNLAFWDVDRQEYRAYWRFFDRGVRAIRTATSQDFLNWSAPKDLGYSADTPREHLYTNAIQKYHRAPHLFVGFPTRYEPRSQQVEPIFMCSRDGVNFTRYSQPVIPRTAPKDRNHNRSNYMVWGIIQRPGQTREMTVYGTENYYESTPGRLREFIYRLDGFVALKLGEAGGSVSTRPFKHSGSDLQFNYQAHQQGFLVIEVLNTDGEVIGQSKKLSGDQIDGTVQWQGGFRLPTNSQPIQLRLKGKSVDLYAFQFVKRK